MAVYLGKAQGFDLLLKFHQGSNFTKEPRVYARCFLNRLKGNPQGEGVVQMKKTLPGRMLQAVHDHLQTAFALAIGPDACAVDFQALAGFLEGFVEASSYAHHLPYRFHLEAQATICTGKFVEIPFGDFDNHIIQGGLKESGGTEGNLIGQFVQTITDCKLGSDFGNRIPGGFGCQRRGAGNAGINFDSDDRLRQGIHGELHIASPGKIPD